MFRVDKIGEVFPDVRRYGGAWGVIAQATVLPGKPTSFEFVRQARGVIARSHGLDSSDSASQGSFGMVVVYLV